jgi:hypothetical protein
LDERKGKIVEYNKKAVAKGAKGASNLDISASSSGRPPALAEPELRVAVTRIVHYGTIWQTRHAGRDRDYRNISDDDIQAMLLSDWVLERVPEWNDDHRNWKYRLLGKDIEGDELTLIVTVNTEEQTLAVITKF